MTTLKRKPTITTSLLNKSTKLNTLVRKPSINTPEVKHNIVQEKQPVHFNIDKNIAKTNFFLLSVIVLGYALKPCHIKWFKFRTGKKRTLIMAPRDHGKTTLLTIAYIIWRIVNNPNIRILLVSNSASMAEMILAGIKSHMKKNKILIYLFGEFEGELWNNSAITVAQRDGVGLREPTISTVGVGGALVSGHYDIVMGEDLVDFENSRTQTQRDKLWNWFWTVVFPTCETSETHPEKDGEIHLLGTRYHFDDFYGRAIGEVDKYAPGVFAKCYVRDKALSDDGIALWPERKSAERLRQIKKDVGSIIFALQYQNDASLTKGRIFQPSNFLNTYKVLPDDVVIVQGTDLAVSKDEESDYFAECVLGFDKVKNVYLIDVWRQRITAPKQYEAIKASHKKWKWIRGGVESVAYQEALSQWLRENTGVPVKSVKRTKDKVMRAYKVQPLFENNKFFMPEGRHFSEFVDEMILFPDGDFDDLFDACLTALDMVFSGDSFSFFFLGDEEEVATVPVIPAIPGAVPRNSLF